MRANYFLIFTCLLSLNSFRISIAFQGSSLWYEIYDIAHWMRVERDIEYVQT